MPAQSKAQQKFMALVYKAKKGEKPSSPAVAKAAKSITKKAAKDFASTKRKGLPNVKEELSANQIVDLMLEGDCEGEECSFEVCPACGGEGYPLGGLGNNVYYRCRDCGITFSKDKSSKKTEPEVKS